MTKYENILSCKLKEEWPEAQLSLSGRNKLHFYISVWEWEDIYSGVWCVVWSHARDILINMMSVTGTPPHSPIIWLITSLITRQWSHSNWDDWRLETTQHVVQKEQISQQNLLIKIKTSLRIDCSIKISMLLTNIL